MSNVFNFLKIGLLFIKAEVILSKSFIVKLFNTKCFKLFEGKFWKGKNIVILGISNFNKVRFIFSKLNDKLFLNFFKISLIIYSPLSLISSRFISNEQRYNKFLLFSISLNKLNKKVIIAILYL